MTDPSSGSHGDARDSRDAAERHGAGGAPRDGEAELFAALDRTRADLAAAPRPAAPEGLTASLLAAVAAEREGTPSRPSEPSPPSPSRRRVARPRRRVAVAVGVAGLAAAAAVVAVVALGAGPGSSARPVPTAAPGPTAPPVGSGSGSPVVLASADLPRALRSGLGARDATADPAARAACFAAHGLPAGTVPVGARAVVLDGRPGTLYVLPTGRTAVFRLLVVGPACAPGSPDTLGDVTVGG